MVLALQSSAVVNDSFVFGLRADMRGAKPKKLQRRAKGEEVSSHWLGEGSDGQQSLFLELDPAIYALDPDLSRLAVGRAHSYDGDEKRPFAVLAPPRDATGWQVALLARHFNVYLWAETETEEFDRAADHFSLEIFIGDLVSEVTHPVDFIAITDTAWESTAQVFSVAAQMIDSLAPEGIACLTFSATIIDSAVMIVCSDGSAISVQELCRALSPRGLVRLETAVQLSQIDRFDRDRNLTFLKRHRDFFGKLAQGFLAERLLDPDFQAAFNDQAAVAVLITITAALEK